ncbi:alanine/glycine:cation symporter family protein [Natronoglycomyces albus]|uniref:Alanine:cation symporter family protein n=1 Tax=Natronoglycomyces albus TaxID=2811108 RepID=A0A895XE73_9ACTN|nr:alanine/glycine:cation symporter family protein [Natronoglycomyces albus]QSB04121.1 alanine:cation symporter family protein [Natronoglycomyces albus]
MEDFLETLGSGNDMYWKYFVIPLLVAVSLYFTLRSLGVQFRLIPHMFRTISETPGQASDGKKGISAFQAFSISAAARVGTGNVVGVSVAISAGGPGAVFWMWVMAIIVAGAAFAESTLGQLYKIREKTSYVGGPAYYMERGLGKRWMGMLFAAILIFTFPFTFMMVQSNTFTGAVNNSLEAAGGTNTNASSVIITLILVTMIAAVIFGGVRRIANVAQTAVPLMAAIYLVIGIAIIAMNIDQIPGVVSNIFGSAFGLREVAGATIGTAIIVGVQRGMFSNEAGMGSVPNAAATASVSHPVKQGLTQSFGVYFDTLLICSITAFIVLVSNPTLGDEEIAGDLVQMAIGESLGAWSIHVLTVVLLFLTFTSCLGNYYYGESNLRFITSNRFAFTAFRSGILVVAFIGGIATLDLVWAFADVTMGVMAAVNLLALIPLSGIVFKLLKDYEEQTKLGIDPVFTRDRIPGLKGVECWEPESERPDASTNESATDSAVKP